MKVSIVACTYSQTRYKDTLETLNSLRNQTYDNIEIVLIIDRNVDLHKMFQAEKELQIYHNLRIGLSQLPGLSNARNKGVELSTGEIIAFIDDDAIADNNWVATLVQNYSNPNIIGAGGLMKPYWMGEVVQWIPEEFYWTMGCSYKSQNLTKHYVRSNFGSNMSFRREIFDISGFFDENYGLMGDIMRTGEETEFSIRALNSIKNSKIVFDPASVVYHRIYEFRKSFKFISKRCLSYGAAIAQMENSKKIIDENLESTESSFIHYLLRFSYVERFFQLIHLQNIQRNILNILALSVLTFIVGVGFLIKKCNNIIKNTKRKFICIFYPTENKSEGKNNN